MDETYKRLSGWSVRHPHYLHEMPQDITDLLVEIRTMEANFEPLDLYPTREEALRTVRRYLTEQKEQALKNLDFLSKPYTSPDGITYICPEHKLEEWRIEARRRLAIAEKGLQICDV